MKRKRDARRCARMLGSALVLGACAAAPPATAWADDVGAKSDTSGEFVETPVGANAAAAPAATPAASGELVEQPVGAAAPSTSPGGSGPLGFLSTASRSSNLLGDMWGARPFLSQYGMTLSVIENSELFGNVSGGVRQGLEYNGLTTATLQMDTQRAFGLNGGLFNASALEIHGGNLSASNLYTLQTASGIEADRAIRLWELWYQQKFGDTLDIKVGQQSLDQEFMVEALLADLDVERIAEFLLIPEFP